MVIVLIGFTPFPFFSSFALESIQFGDGRRSLVRTVCFRAERWRRHSCSVPGVAGEIAMRRMDVSPIMGGRGMDVPLVRDVVGWSC